MSAKELREKLGTLNAQARAIIEVADKDPAGKRELTADESAKVDVIYADYDKIKDQADAAEKADSQRNRLAAHDEYMKQSAGRKADPGAGAAAPVVASAEAGQPLKFDLRGHSMILKPGTPEHTRASADYREKFQAYLTNGIHAGLATTTDSKGGYLTSTQMSLSLIKFLDDNVFMRELSTVLPPLGAAVSLGIPSFDTDYADADWTAEVPASAITEDDAARFGKRELTPHLLTKLIKISMKLIRAGIFDIEAFISERLGYRFAVTEEKAFLTGNGNQKPLGVFVASTSGISTGRDTTAASTSAFTADELIDTLYNLKEQYQRNATWLLHRQSMKRIRKLKDGNGQYIWAPGLAAGQPGVILDRPYKMSEFAPSTFTTGLYVAIIGDFKAGYWIVDSLNFEIQRLSELLALTNQIGLIGRKETDGMPVLEEAFSRLKLA